LKLEVSLDFLKFCSATLFQFFLFFVLMFLLSKWRFEFQRATRRLFGVPSASGRSFSKLAFAFLVISMGSLLLAAFEISMLVLNAPTLKTLIFTVCFLGAIAYSQKRRLIEKIKPFLHEDEPAPFISFSFILSLLLIFVSISVDLSFRFGVQSAPIEARVETVKPARLGSSIRSVQVQIPAHELSRWSPGISFYRFDSRENGEAISVSQKLNLELQKGSLGLNRAIPTPQLDFLKNHIFGR
jgi:hypothetical protein